MKRLDDARPFWVSSVLVLGACGAAPLPDEARVTGLHFTTSSTFPDNPPPTNIDVTLTDPTRVRVIYSATLGLPDFPPGLVNCPADFGYAHKITFTNGQTVVGTATLDAGGCRDATISGPPQVRQTDDAYWALVARNLGIDGSALFSVAHR